MACFYPLDYLKSQKKIVVQEFGWIESNRVESFKRMLWKLIYKSNFPEGGVFNKKADNQLNGTLKHLFDTGMSYFPVNFEDDNEDKGLIRFINDGTCYAQLKNDLPDFRLLIIRIGEKQSPLLINDNELEGELLGFFELEPK